MIEILIEHLAGPAVLALLGAVTFLAGYEIGWRDGQEQARR